MFANCRKSRGTPDGLHIDANGFVWRASFRGGNLTRYDRNGNKREVVETPGKFVTSLTFGGANNDVIFITSPNLDGDSIVYFAITNITAKYSNIFL